MHNLKKVVSRKGTRNWSLTYQSKVVKKVWNSESSLITGTGSHTKVRNNRILKRKQLF